METNKGLEFDFENTFNAEEYLYFYQNILTSERTKKEIDFLIKYAEIDHPLEILDLACGHGRHANVLAQLGHEVTGIDYTQEFLKIAQEEASKLGVKVNYIHMDMRKIDYSCIFDRIFVLFTAIGYFDDDQNEQVFKNIFHALKPNGIFCFDSHNRDTFSTYYSPSSVVKREGNFLIDHINFDSLSSRSVTKRTIIYNQLTKSFQFSIRLYSPTEIMKLLKKIGFSTITLYEDLNGKLLGPESKRMFVLARK